MTVPANYGTEYSIRSISLSERYADNTKTYAMVLFFYNFTACSVYGSR